MLATARDFAASQARRERHLHQFSPEEVRQMFTPAKLRRALRYPDGIPLVGSEKGDRSEVERVPLQSVTLTAGQPTVISRELIVGDPWLAIRLNLRGQLVGAVGAAGTVVADAPLQLWALSMTTDVDRDVIEPSVSARAIYRYNQFINGTAGELVAPTVVASTTTDFNAVVTIPFVDERLVSPMDSVLDTRRYQTVVLTITTGVLGDIVTGAANLTLGTVTVDMEIVRVSPRVPLPVGVMKALPFFKRHAPITPAADTSILLDKIPTLAIKRLGFFASSGSTAGVPFTGPGSNAVIDTLRVSSNLRDHIGSAIGGGLSRRTIQGGNKDDYSIETWPAGWYIGDFVLDGSLWSALATGDKSSLQAILTYQAGLPGTPQLSLLVAGVQKLRGTEAL